MLGGWTGGVSFLSFTFLPAALLLARCKRVCVGLYVRVYLFICMRSTFLGFLCLLMKIKRGLWLGSALHPLEQQMKWISRLLHYRGLLSLFSTAFHTAESLSNPRLIAIMIFSHHNSPDVSLIGIHRWRAPINRPHLSPAPSEQKVLACALRQIVSQLQLYHIILLSSFTGIEKW